MCAQYINVCLTIVFWEYLWYHHTVIGYQITIPQIWELHTLTFITFLLQILSSGKMSCWPNPGNWGVQWPQRLRKFYTDLILIILTEGTAISLQIGLLFKGGQLLIRIRSSFCQHWARTNLPSYFTMLIEMAKNNKFDHHSLMQSWQNRNL